MAKKNNNKNLLPLLALTAFMLSVGLINFNGLSNNQISSTQMVLSKSTEEGVEDEVKNDEKPKVEVKIEKQKNENSGKSGENMPKKTEKPEKIEKVEDVSNELELEFEQEVESASPEGVNKFKLKVKTKELNGKSIVETESGEMIVENNPEDIANELVEDEVIDVPVSIDTEVIDNKVNFEVSGIESKKLFGLFNINLPKTATVDSQTGELISTSQGFWTKILGFLSR